MKIFIKLFGFFVISLFVSHTIKIILFGIDEDVNSWIYRSGVLISSLLSSVLLALLGVFLIKKGILKFNKK